MFTDITWQDWQATPENERPELLEKIISRYKASADFTTALAANAYFRGENTAVMQKVILQKGRYKVESRDEQGRKVTRMVDRDKAIVGARLPASFMFRFVTQQNQFLLGNGVTLDEGGQKERLGLGFDKTVEQMGEMALLAGVSWGFWNIDHLEAISAARDSLSGFVALVDEETSAPMVGVQFWQIAKDRPLRVRLFEVDGVTVYRKGKDSLELTQAKRPYMLTMTQDAAGPVNVTGSNYGALPLIPLYANTEQRSEFTPSIRAKIDAYDRISSDFVDNLDKANDVYWVLNNFGGTLTDMQEMIDTVRRTGIVASLSDGTGSSSTAQPHAFEVPYNARQTALQILEKELYKDYMAVNMDELTGGSLTNVAIKTAMTNLNLKADRYEWQVFQFVQKVLSLLGIKTEQITFKRQEIANKSEIVSDIAAMRQDIDLETALKLNPYINQEDIESIIANVAAEQMSGLPTIEELEKTVQED
jgi:hypothetical protein